MPVPRGARDLQHCADIVLDEESLPFASESLDALIWILGLEQLNDVPGTLIQIRRALRGNALAIGAMAVVATADLTLEDVLAALGRLARLRLIGQRQHILSDIIELLRLEHRAERWHETFAALHQRLVDLCHVAAP